MSGTIPVDSNYTYGRMQCLKFSVCVGILLLSPLVRASACSCVTVTVDSACAGLDGLSAVFSGTVTDTGPTIQGIDASELPEATDELEVSYVKRIWASMLPAEAQSRLEAVRTEDELQQLVTQYFPVSDDWSRPVQFDVEETFLGEHQDDREVWTGQGFGDCGFGFELGEKYLVFAYRDLETGRDETSICTGTRKLSGVPDEELEHLRAVPEGVAGPRVYGVVTQALEVRELSPWGGQPLVGVRITLNSEEGVEVTKTDSTGRFSFEQLNDGSYSLSAEAEGYRFPRLPMTMELKGATCLENVILAEPVNRQP